MSRSLSGKSTNRAAFLINCLSTVITLFSPPTQFLLLLLAAANAMNHRDKLHSAAGSTCSRDCWKYLVPLPFCREHPGMRILQLCGAEQGVWGFAPAAFSLCRLFVPWVSLGAARAWQVPLHRALASPKQPLSSSVRLGCQLLLLFSSLLGEPH